MFVLSIGVLQQFLFFEVMELKLRIIGYWGGYPKTGGATSCYLLEKDGFTLVLDFGSGALSQLQKYKPVDEIDAVILSHYHHDHVADVGVLQYAKLIQYYVTGSEHILPIYGHTEDKEAFRSLDDQYTRAVAYDPKAVLTIGPFQITFLQTKHPVPCYGMRITDQQKTIVYTADTSYQDEWIPFSKHADLLITDCNYYAHQDGRAAGHMTSKEGGKIAAQANVGELILSHLPQFGDLNRLKEEAQTEFDGKIRLAEDGLTWE